MEQGVKLRLGVALLLTQIVLYYYFPRPKHSEGDVGVPADFCRISPVEEVCWSPIAAFSNLCPLPKTHFILRKDEKFDDIDPTNDKENRHDENQETNGLQRQTKQTGEKTQEPKGEDNKLPQSQEEDANKEEKKRNLIYQIIVVLLVVSVTASLADCFHERSRRRANPDAFTTNSRGEPTLNRRMSLADLTMQRHARRESQASFRPPGTKQLQEAFMERRSSSQESPRTPNRNAPSRQRSCPAPFLRRLSTIDLQDTRDGLDGSWAERRRVRMIQRH